MSRESVFENMGTGFSSLEISQEIRTKSEVAQKFVKICWDNEILNTLNRFDG